MGTRNTLGDLNNHLFIVLERLNDEDIQGERLEEEMQRAKAVSGIAKDVVSNANLVLQATKFQDDKIDYNLQTPNMLEG